MSTVESSIYISFLFSGKTQTDTGMFDKLIEEKTARTQTKKNRNLVSVKIYELHMKLDFGKSKGV